MTREEAIKILVDGLNDNSIDMLDDEQEEALQMAIQALQAQADGDLISRQEVLDYIYNDLGLGDEENGKDLERQMELEDSYKYVKSLPPIATQPKTGHWIRVTDKAGHLVWECDKCCWQQRFNTNFCPDCGAKMIER